ncbi:MAG: DUF2225 domain-containing protein [Treponema sp.]|jgi:uncharacterized protein (DUF2225 family)|nr:DUF2225 domain-containing protein [Treponema sp.]
MAAELKISFQAKDKITCPVCGTDFHREELRSGSGRLIAGALTDELHRLYDPSIKYGDVYPLAYTATVCPRCWFASTDQDFCELPPERIDRAQKDEKKRKELVNLIFPQVDFMENRGLINGAASHYLVLRSYDYFPPEFSPTLKQGIAALRTGWLLESMDKKYPGQHFDWLALLFKKKAQFCYTEAIRREEAGEENLSGVKLFGPDTDKNYGYEGALYLSGLLLLKYGPLNNPGNRRESMTSIKRIIAKIFGMGKASKGKPGPLLEHVKELYVRLNQELNESDS